MAAPNPASPLTKALRLGTASFAFAGLFSLVTNLLYLALPLYTMQIYNRVLASQSEATLYVVTVGAVGAFIVSGLVDHFRAQVLINFGVVFDQRVAGPLFATLFEAVVRKEPGARSQAMRDLDTLRQTITGSAIGVMFDLPWIPIFMIVLFMIDPIIGLVTLAGGFLLLGLAILQDKGSRGPLKAANDAALQSYAFTEAALRNGEVVRALGMLSALGAQWTRFRETTMERSAAASERSSIYGGAIRLVRMTMQIIIVGLGAWLIIKGKIGPGVLFANMILGSRALAPIERVVGSWAGLIAGQQAYDRVSKLLDSYEPAPPSIQLPRPNGLLSVEAVSFAPRGAEALVLNGISFQLPAGETLGVVGPSGAGKSTLTRLLVGVWKPNGGSVRLDGADVFQWERESFGRYVGYLPQDIELFSGTVRGNICRFRADATDEAVVKAAQLAGAHEMILRLPQGYETQLTEQGGMLSAGQRQRVGLARALFGEPAYIVLDEPNAALDAEGEAALMRTLEILRRRNAPSSSSPTRPISSAPRTRCWCCAAAGWRCTGRATRSWRGWSSPPPRSFRKPRPRDEQHPPWPDPGGLPSPRRARRRGHARSAPADERPDRRGPDHRPGVRGRVLRLGGPVLGGGRRARARPGGGGDNRKSVEQLDGGVVRKINVREGDKVVKGQVLFLMDDTQARAQVDVLSNEYDGLLAQKARLDAELADAPEVTFPPELLARRSDPRVDSLIKGQETLFRANRGVYDSQVGVLNQRLQQSKSRTQGLQAQVNAVDQENKLVADELQGVQTLYDRGFAPKSRLLALQRSQADLEGTRGAHVADIAASGQAAGETQMQLAQVRQQRATQSADILRQVEVQIADALPKLRAAQAVLDRTVVRSPADGYVLGLTQFTEGGVAKPGERLADIVPQNTPLQARVMIKPDAIHDVHVGMNAQVKLTGFPRSTPPFNAKVVTVSADRVTDEKGNSFFTAELVVDPAELKKAPTVKLSPGMPLQAIIVTKNRSVLEYLVDPFTSTFADSLHER